MPSASAASVTVTVAGQALISSREGGVMSPNGTGADGGTSSQIRDVSVSSRAKKKPQVRGLRSPKEVS
jgi:hypothetical protein